ncbi:MAG: YggS family pyridoxal phosphate-dependent enzyme [Phycisphaerales bacterium]|jgi:pyridoxal phosphate enzyme (YggS family)
MGAGASGTEPTLEARYNEVCDRVAAAAKKSGRRAQDVILVAVTKNADQEQIRELFNLGHRDFGENRVQQLVHRAAMMAEWLGRQRRFPTARSIESASNLLFSPGSESDLAPDPSQPSARDGIRWHMIGHLQRNKSRKVIEFTRLIHSVDSLRLAEEIQAAALRRDQVVEVLLQINCSGEASKFGCSVPAAAALAEQIDTMINVKLRGVMTMAAPGADPEDARGCFARCRDLYEEIRPLVSEPRKFNILSMGMSDDYEVAISEGANIVRVGSAIFGDTPSVEIPEEAEEPDPAETES